MTLETGYTAELNFDGIFKIASPRSFRIPKNLKTYFCGASILEQKSIFLKITREHQRKTISKIRPVDKVEVCKTHHLTKCQLERT